MALVCFVVSFSTARAQNSNLLDDVNAQPRTMFSAINPYQQAKPAPIEVEIMSLQGSKVASTVLQPAQTDTQTYQTLDLSVYKLPAGVYMILFRTDAKTFIQRLILR
jgi:hypothetical protein